MMILFLLLTNWLVPAPNPIRLDANGRAPAIYLQQKKAYRIVLYAANEQGHPSGWYCNGTPVGRQIWEHDRVSDIAGPDDFPPTLPMSQSQFFDKNGKPSAGGYVCTFKSGTHQPQYALRLR